MPEESPSAHGPTPEASARPPAERPSAPPPAPPRPGRRSRLRRALLAIGAVAAAEIIGTVGFHAIEGVSWINAFYFESMLATGQGPPFALVTSIGKVFASIMGFVSVGSTLSAVIFTLGPLLTRIWRNAVEDVEGHVRAFEHRVADDVRRLEDELR